MSLKRIILPSLFIASIAVSLGACSCGDDDGGVVPDGSVDDIDGSVTEPSQTGRIVMAAASFHDLPAPFDMLGEGMLQIVDVYPVDERPAFAYEQAPGSNLGCKVTEFTPETLAEPPVNMGTLEFTIENGPAFPTCNFVDGVGYACVAAAGMAAGDIADPATPAPPALTLTDPAVTFGADTVGLKVQISGAGVVAPNGGNNGLFNIVNAMGDNTIIYPNPNYGAHLDGGGSVGDFNETLGAGASYQVVAGLGPAGQEDPVPDNARIMTQLTAGGNGAFTDYTTDVDVGDSFTLDDATADIIDDLPLDGSEFALSCDGAGGSCSGAMATAIIIQTTDADVSMLPPFVLPPPETKAVRIFCLQPMAASVTIPAEASAFLMNSGATRIRAIMVRGNNTPTLQADATTDNVAGHAIAGFTQVLPD